MTTLTLLALLAGTVSASPALAQANDPGRFARAKAPDPSRRDDIVVTGRNVVVADSSAATKSDARFSRRHRRSRSSTAISSTR